jgi:citrate lyase beta subunit
VHSNRVAEADAAVTRLRSLLFVPGDRPDRIAKALDTGADAIILDLEDSVAPARKPLARSAIAECLNAAPRRAALFMRINPVDSEHAVADLALVSAGRPDAIVLPKAEGADTVRELLQRMSVACPILPINRNAKSRVRTGQLPGGRRASHWNFMGRRRLARGNRGKQQS